MNYGVSRIGHPTPVGTYPANAWGFYDTHGNVWQYCADGGRLAAMGGADLGKTEAARAELAEKGFAAT